MPGKAFGKRPDRRSREDAVRPAREDGLGRKIGLHARVTLEVVLCEIGPEGRLRPEMKQGFGLERAHFANGRDFGRTPALRRDQAREGPADVAGRGGAPPRTGERMA